MTAADALDDHVHKVAVMLLAVGGPNALNAQAEVSRFDRMAKELEFAIHHTPGADMTALIGYLASDAGSALMRRMTGLANLAGRFLGGTVNELGDMISAYSADQLGLHLRSRVDTASAITSQAVSNGAQILSSLATELMSNPSEAAPKLLVLVLASVAASGGVDGNGGIPDIDIPLMGIGAHRSPFTHSILIGSLLETSLLLLTRIVRLAYQNLPEDHDPLWEGIVRQADVILSAAGKGASIGIAYHLMVDAIIQPGAYHGMPFDMPMEAHQAVMAGNSVAEASAATAYPGEETVTATAEVLAIHKKYRAIRMPVSPVLQEYLSTAEISILTKYGSWLQALAKGVVPPTTLAQVQFVKVAEGICKPTTAHDQAWVSWLAAKRRAGWTTGGAY